MPPVKIHCSVLARDAIRAAIGNWKKNGYLNHWTSSLRRSLLIRRRREKER